MNVLIALLDPDHSKHAAAHSWWSSNTAAGWATCPLTQNGFVRIVTQLGYEPRLSLIEALERLDRETARADHEFWPDDIEIIDQTKVHRSSLLGPKQITDVYLLALAVKKGGRFVTFDRSVPVAAVHGAKPEHLVKI